MDTTEEQEELMFIVKEQSRELTSALAMSIDLDLAFNIQIQEAIAASLIPHSSQIESPTSITPPPLPILNQVDYNFEESVEEDYLASVIAQEMARYEQEKSDHKQAEEEMLRFREEIGLMVHDRRFAEEIYRVPENQWVRTGSRLERPYGDGGSPSCSTASSVPNIESFKLYTKGILSKGTEIQGNYTIFGGIGIVLCDIWNNVFFRVAKPVVGMEIVSEVVELNALTEGLRTTLELGIKNIFFCTENAELHGYLEGNSKPEHGNIESLFDQVTLLLSEFSYFTSVLVDPKEVRISAKFALNAIDSQMNREMLKIRNLNSVNCSICMEDINHFQMYYIEDCLHSYCHYCMIQHVEGQLLNGALPKCPNIECESFLTVDSCRNFLPPRIYNIFKDRVREASIPAANRIYCPNPKCSELMSQSEDIANVAMECVKCGLLFCGQCRAPWHNDISCDTYALLYPNETDEDDAKLKSVAADKKWKQCGNCKTMVELDYGCYHIICRCGHQFCYVCGAPWKDDAPTCGCRLWDERNLHQFR